MALIDSRREVSVMRVLLALICVLTLATSAHAECGWVLWNNDVSEPTIRRTPMEAYDTRRECNAALEKWRSGGLRSGVVLSCLPDTVDPRGPRGK